MPSYSPLDIINDPCRAQRTHRRSPSSIYSQIYSQHGGEGKNNFLSEQHREPSSGECCLCSSCHLSARLFPRRGDGKIILPLLPGVHFSGDHHPEPSPVPEMRNMVGPRLTPETNAIFWSWHGTHAKGSSNCVDVNASMEGPLPKTEEIALAPISQSSNEHQDMTTSRQLSSSPIIDFGPEECTRVMREQWENTPIASAACSSIDTQEDGVERSAMNATRPSSSGPPPGMLIGPGVSGLPHHGPSVIETPTSTSPVPYPNGFGADTTQYDVYKGPPLPPHPIPRAASSISLSPTSSSSPLLTLRSTAAAVSKSTTVRTSTRTDESGMTRGKGRLKGKASERCKMSLTSLHTSSDQVLAPYKPRRGRPPRSEVFPGTGEFKVFL